MFNLTVDTAHTFYIGVNGWLVHNEDRLGLPCDVAAVFRGTTEEYSGRHGVTFTSTDPAVATLYALEHASFGGNAVVHIGTPNRLLEAETSTSGIGFLVDDKQILINNMSPNEFSAAAHTIPATRAIEILSEMGISLPKRVSGITNLQRTLNRLPAMTPAQIVEFLKRAGVK